MESTDQLLAGLFGSARMREQFSDRARVQGMLDFEAALARAEARAGLIPAKSAESISSACVAALFDLEMIGREAAQAGNTAIPLIRQLTAKVAETNPDAAQFVHFGATSQDAMDTGLVLQMRAGLDILGGELALLSEATAQLVQSHRDTLMAGRTWLQQALPVSFGARAAGWLDALQRHRLRLAALRPGLLVLQFGGAAGTLASLDHDGLTVARFLAAELNLGLPAIPWHAHRDRIAEIATALAILDGTLGKVARDISLLMQTELGEVSEPGNPGRGGSSAMPHKRNPVSCSAILATAIRAPALAGMVMTTMVQEHERGLGNWPVEWSALPELFQITAGALEQTQRIIAGLEVHPVRMRENLEATKGLIFAEAVKMALAPELGARESHRIVEKACRRATAKNLPLAAILKDTPAVNALLDPAAVDTLFDPERYLGMSGQWIDQVLAAWKNRDCQED